MNSQMIIFAVLISFFGSIFLLIALIRLFFYIANMYFTCVHDNNNKHCQMILVENPAYDVSIGISVG